MLGLNSDFWLLVESMLKLKNYFLAALGTPASTTKRFVAVFGVYVHLLECFPTIKKRFLAALGLRSNCWRFFALLLNKKYVFCRFLVLLLARAEKRSL